MATFETASLGLNVFNWVSNVRRNIRENCQAYKAQITAGRPVAGVAAIANADAAEYLKTIGGLDLYISDVNRRAKLLDALAVFGIDQTAAAAELSALRAAAEGQRDASKTTANQINNMANAILAGLPSYDLPARLTN